MVVLVVGTVNFHWTNSFGAIGLNTLSRLKGYTILLHGRKSLDLCQICLIPIEIGIVGMPSRGVGYSALWLQQYLGYCQRLKFSTVNLFFYFFFFFVYFLSI